jgi:SlyX protein
MEDRIMRLEELVALQDRTIEKLGEEVAAQQRELMEMERRVRLLGERVRSLGQAGPAPEDGGGDEPPPPHYL